MSTHEIHTPRPELGPLDILAGAWSIEALFPNMPTGHGRTTFEWASGGAFLLQRVELRVDRSVVPHDAAPDSIAIIGRAADGNAYLQHYFDARGVARLYQMTLDAQTWSLTTSRRLTSHSTTRARSAKTVRPSPGTGRARRTPATGKQTSISSTDARSIGWVPAVGQIGSTPHGGEDV